MSGGLIVAGKPSNLRYARGHVEGDVFNICQRLTEIDKSLFVDMLDPPVQYGDKTYNFAVVEECADGVTRLVFRVEALDARIIEQVQYLMSVPFETRFAEAEAIADKADAEFREAEFQKLYEEMGAPMLRQLHHDGFSQRRSYYATRGAVGGKGSRGRS